MFRLKTDYDVVIVGLGPVGLISTAMFAKAGLKVLAIEKSDGSHVLPRATAMDDENLRTLLKLGPDFVEEFLLVNICRFCSRLATLAFSCVPRF